jgi:hypothetical protein
VSVGRKKMEYFQAVMAVLAAAFFVRAMFVKRGKVA